MRSLAFKLTLAFLLVGLAGSLIVAVVLQVQTRNAFDRFILNREQQILVDNLVQYYQVNGGWAGLEDYLGYIVGPILHEPGSGREIRRGWERFTLVDSDRTVVFSMLPGQQGKQITYRELDRAVPLEVDGAPVGWLILAPNAREWVANSPEAIFLRNINRATRFSALIAALLAFALGGLLAFNMTRSLRELTEATLEIARGKLGKQVKVRSQDELGELAGSFNKMSLDLERAVQSRRQMTADIAHDLRTPLSVIAGYAEALSDGKLDGTPEVYAILHQETRHLNRLVEDLRTLSLADAGELTLTLQPAQSNTILEGVAARHAMTAQQRGISLLVDVQADLPPLQVDVERMAQVLDNLVVNAFRYTPSGGEVVLAAKENHGAVQLQVRDTGSGISPEDLPHIFDRFYRGDKSRQGSGESGLGLAIAKSIVEAHGGT
ncbi:MAG: HAMP domain-containing protein, partial [Chloroflexota bacterium]